MHWARWLAFGGAGVGVYHFAMDRSLWEQAAANPLVQPLVHLQRTITDFRRSREGSVAACRLPWVNGDGGSGADQRGGGPLGFLTGLFAAHAREPETETPTFYPAADRIIAVGDIHGDLDALRSVLRLSKLLGNNDEWIGGNSVLVQVGDLLDRGDQERAVLDLLMRLRQEARTAGGAVHVLNGNHEIMNVSLDFRYVTPGGFKDFDSIAAEAKEKGNKLAGSASEVIKSMPEFMKMRALSLRPGGFFSNLLSRHQVAIVIGDNAFVHGGLRPTHLAEPGALESMNSGCRAWMQGKADKPSVLKTGKSPIWMRHYSHGTPKTGSDECNVLQATLDLIPAKRMVVGHTPQQSGINAACAGKVWRVDTGMAAAYGGPHEALEITKNRIRVLTTKGWRSSHSRTTG